MQLKEIKFIISTTVKIAVKKCSYSKEISYRTEV